MLATVAASLCAFSTSPRLGTPTMSLANNPANDMVYRRAEFWDGFSTNTATMIDIVNVLGRWEKCDEWSTRTKFTEVENPRDTSEAQAGTLNRYEMAQNLGVVERVALQQNCPQLPFRDAGLAAGVGLSVSDFADMPVKPAAVNIVYDALAESRSGLLPAEKIEARRNAWLNENGALNSISFATSLYKARFAVILSWFLFGKGNIVGIIVILKVIGDALGDSSLFDVLMANQEAALVVAFTGAAMATVGQQQEAAEDLQWQEKAAAEKARTAKANAAGAAKAAAEGVGTVVPTATTAAEAEADVSAK